jgi:hypothetical protein
MLHDYAMGTNGQGQSLKDISEHAEERFNSLTKSLYVETGYMTNAEWERFKDGKEFWLSSKKAAERGLLTHVILRNGDIVTSEDFIKICNGVPTEEEATILEAQEKAEKASAKKKKAAAKKIKKAKADKLTKKKSKKD